MIYLDNNATTRLADEALSAMLPYFTEIYGNSHAAHRLGRDGEHAAEHAREQVASLLGASSHDILFTSCGTESNAMVLHGFAANTERRKVVSLSVEHPSNLATLRMLQSLGRLELVVVEVEPDGSLDLDRLRAAVDDDTALVCAMLAQNETGIIYPIREIAAIAHASGAMVLVDAVQAAGKVPIAVKELGVDFLSISGHKFHAPKGMGALYIHPDRSLTPIWMGGGHERGLRSGTTPVPLAVALGEASRVAAEAIPRRDDVKRLRDLLESEIARSCDVVIHGRDLERLPNTALISFRGLFSDEIVRALDGRDIAVSGGAACDSGKREPSSVMRAMKQPNEIGLGAVRFSLSRYTTEREIRATIEAVAEVTAAMSKSLTATVES
jgi:cysteine desulfurase